MTMKSFFVYVRDQYGRKLITSIQARDMAHAAGLADGAAVAFRGLALVFAILVLATAARQWLREAWKTILDAEVRKMP